MQDAANAEAWDDRCEGNDCFWNWKRLKSHFSLALNTPQPTYFCSYQIIIFICGQRYRSFSTLLSSKYAHFLHKSFIVVFTRIILNQPPSALRIDLYSLYTWKTLRRLHCTFLSMRDTDRYYPHFHHVLTNCWRVLSAARSLHHHHLPRAVTDTPCARASPHKNVKTGVCLLLPRAGNGKRARFVQTSGAHLQQNGS